MTSANLLKSHLTALVSLQQVSQIFRVYAINSKLKNVEQHNSWTQMESAKTVPLTQLHAQQLLVK